MLSISKFSLMYRDKKLFENLELPKLCNHNIVYIYGENGSGKTSLLRSICSLEKYKGNITYSGKIFYVFNDPPFYDNNSGLDNLVVFSKKRKSKILDYLQENDYLFLSINKLQDKAINYSCGERKLLAFMLALVCDTSIYLLDEFLSGLDQLQRYKCINVLNNIKKESIIIMTGHEHIYLDIANIYYCIDKGKLVNQTRSEIDRYFALCKNNEDGE